MVRQFIGYLVLYEFVKLFLANRLNVLAPGTVYHYIGYGSAAD
jgi:hypothetical protein